MGFNYVELEKSLLFRVVRMTDCLKTLSSLLQMSDVPSGGATVFTDVGAAVWPKKVRRTTVRVYIAFFSCDDI